MKVKIKYKFALTLLVVSVAAAIPLSLYILDQQQKEKIESIIAIGRSNTRLLARTMLDVFLKTGGDPASMRIDAEEAIAVYKDQADLGLLFGQTIMLTQKHRGLIMATLNIDFPETAADNKNGKEQKIETTNQASQPTRKKETIRHTEQEIQNFLQYEENHLGPCFHQIEKKCYNFAYAAKYEKVPVVLAVMSISEDHILQPIHRLKRLIYISAAVAVIVSLLIGLFVSRFITGPIQALVNGVQRYSRGELSTRVHVKVNDELRTLGEAFNEMAEQIAAKIKEIEDHRDNLEIKVQERTAELRAALTEVSKLKEQQDADYYLTTFLYKPLCVNQNSSSYIQTEFFIKQKKEFIFRNKKAEIGGDICITANLLFREPTGEVNRYLFVTNADAMGKSLQGAGGAIVYGTAVNTILKSSTANNRVLQTLPQDWLVRMYHELHNIFLSFNGSMLVSGVLLLINEHNGKAYYLNVEHPWTILYRDHKPSFIENELMLRKFGADMPGYEVRVKEFTFFPGDVLFLGSDGRDDIILRQDMEGQNIINEDEYAILEAIAQADGDLRKTIEVLQEMGTLSDDLSFVRVEILGLNDGGILAPAESVAKPDTHQILGEIRQWIQKKNFAEAAQKLQNLSAEVDVETMPQYYVLLSRVQAYNNQLELARNSLEKALSLGHKTASTYKSLGNIYYRLNMKQEAKLAWEAALKINPQDDATKKMLAKLTI